jgi:sulfoxide reductase heme-binding subunit YedZ
MRAIINSKIAAWMLLALPAVAMAHAFATGRSDALDLLHPTGETAVRLMVVALCLGPLQDVLGQRSWLRWLLARRRWIGVAAFGYALAHLVFYAIDLGSVADILAEFTEHAIWTGWLALLAMAVPALISTDTAMRVLRQTWKRLQRLVYVAALFTVVHWGLIEWQWLPALVHIAPIVVLNLLRLHQQHGVKA